jgi:hypothetical protein
MGDDVARTPADEPGAGTRQSNQVDLPGSSELARRILRRYAERPGVLPLAATLGLAERVSRIGSGRSSLAMSIYRRWLGDPPPARSAGILVPAPPSGSDAGATVNRAAATARSHPDPPPSAAPIPRDRTWPAETRRAVEPSPAAPPPSAAWPDALPSPARAAPSTGPTAGPSVGELESPIRRRPRATLGPTIQRSAAPAGADAPGAAPLPSTSPEPPAGAPAADAWAGQPAPVAPLRSEPAGPGPAGPSRGLALARAASRGAGGWPEATPPAEVRPTAPATAGSARAPSAAVVPAGGAGPTVAVLTPVVARSAPPVPLVARAVDHAAGASRGPGAEARPTVAPTDATGPVRRAGASPVVGPLVLPTAPVPSGPAIARQVEPDSTAPTPGGSPLAASAAPAATTSAEAALDVEALVDRVLRKLARQLAVEGERRGWQRWP